jgi:hypothetical protein
LKKKKEQDYKQSIRKSIHSKNKEEESLRGSKKRSTYDRDSDRPCKDARYCFALRNAEL